MREARVRVSAPKGKLGPWVPIWLEIYALNGKFGAKVAKLEVWVQSAVWGIRVLANTRTLGWDIPF